MKLRNLKASFILRKKVTTPTQIKNFIIKDGKFTFTIYHHSPNLVNVTGVKTFEQMHSAKKIIEQKLEQSVMKVRIDNTFFSQKNYRNVDLNKVYKFMQHSETFHVDYNVELFAGMYFHPKKVNYPTILFFRTGSYTMMGGKEMEILNECETFVNELIETFDKLQSMAKSYSNQKHGEIINPIESDSN
jgi:TATA-box binding protein (TBP) (component of TFIID and TFIIIB)